MQLKLEFVPMPTKIKCKEYEKIETAGIFTFESEHMSALIKMQTG